MPDVLLRDFDDDGIPKDFRVTFCDSLPLDVVCYQCENVSSSLFRDLEGHGYCRSCRDMCRRGTAFECSACDRECQFSKLKQDSSVPTRIRNAKIICPKTTRGNPVAITFSALKAHLKECFCNVAGGGGTREMWSPGSSPSGKQKSPVGSGMLQEARKAQEHLSITHQGNAKPAEPHEESKSSKMAVCSYCKERLPKRSIAKHIEDCRQELQSIQYEPPPEPEMSTDLPKPEMDSYEDDLTASKFTASRAGSLTGAMYAKEREPLALSANPAKLAQLLSDALSRIYDLEQEIEELKAASAKTKDDTDMLSAAFPAIQEDMRNVQIRCEQRISKSEKSASSLEESNKSLEKMVSMIDEETKARLGAVEETMKNMTEKLSSDVHELKGRSTWLRGAYDRLSGELAKLTHEFHQFVLNTVPAEDESKKGKKGPKGSK